MPKTPFIFLVLCGLCAAAFAQDAPATAKTKAADAKPAEKPGFVPTPASPATPAPQSPGVLQRIFGSRQKSRTLFPTTPAPQGDTAAPDAAKAKARPAPAVKKIAPKKTATAEDETPAPKKRKHKPKAVAEETEPAAKNPPETAAAKPPVEKEVPTTTAPAKKLRKGKAAPVAAATEGNEPPADADPETKEKFRFDQAKAKAAEDPEVKVLKAKADGAASDDEARSAQRAYNKALFGKMRKIDGSLDERIGQMEAAILKRLDGK